MARPGYGRSELWHADTYEEGSASKANPSLDVRAAGGAVSPELRTVLSGAPWPRS